MNYSYQISRYFCGLRSGVAGIDPCWSPLAILHYSLIFTADTPRRVGYLQRTACEKWPSDQQSFFFCHMWDNPALFPSVKLWFCLKCSISTLRRPAAVSLVLVSTAVLDNTWLVSLLGRLATHQSKIFVARLCDLLTMLNTTWSLVSGQVVSPICASRRFLMV